MREFYRIRQGGQRTFKAEALRQAQLRILRGEVRPAAGAAERGVRKPVGTPAAPGWSLPCYWAPFSLMADRL